MRIKSNGSAAAVLTHLTPEAEGMRIIKGSIKQKLQPLAETMRNGAQEELSKASLFVHVERIFGEHTL